MSKIYNSKNYLFGDKVYVINGDGTELKEYTLSNSIKNVTFLGTDNSLSCSSAAGSTIFATPHFNTTRPNPFLNFDVGIISEKIVTDKKEIEVIKAMIFAEEI